MMMMYARRWKRPALSSWVANKKISRNIVRLILNLVSNLSLKRA